jgi:hypothetical protein
MQNVMGAQYTPANYVDFIEAEIKRGCVAISDTFYTKHELGAGRINAYRSLTQWGRIAHNYITNDTTWANSVYVSGDIWISAGYTLTIEPGTTVYFASDDNQDLFGDSTRIQFDIWGTLNANGTAQNPIVFKSMAEEPQPGAWGGIWFKGESSSGSLSHCIIQDGQYGVESAATIHMSNCEIENCEIAGIYMYDNLDSNSVVNNSSTISDCVVHFNGEDAAGMRIWNCPDTISVDSCTVAYNECGIWVSNACPRITMSNINYNSSQGIWVTSYRYPSPIPYPAIRWCHMQGNGQAGIRCQYNSAKVSYSKSWQNGAYGIEAFGAGANPAIDHSKIISNGSAGVRADQSGSPVLGIYSLGVGQYNSLYSQTKNVYNATSQTVYAERCWWGSSPPDQSKFYGSVGYAYYLGSDPVPYLAPFIAKTPTVLSLDQNFPNPFGGATGVTTIKYSIPGEAGKAVLQVYDVLGRRVRTLVNKPHHPGSYYVKWDGRNDRGARVAPGVYFYQLNVGKQSFTKKIVLAR